MSSSDMAGRDNTSSGDLAVAVHSVSKMYRLYADPRDRLKQSLWYALPAFMRRKPRQFYREFWALRNVSFTLKRGEALGILGRNGSGKSTLLQLIAGILTPTEGELQVNGRVTALLELGSGFNPEFTGRENVYLNGAILGLSQEEIAARFEEIAAFADIGEFIDQPVKHYSSGMFVRLAFAVQVCVEPDILLVDEALSVGDILFRQKCHTRMERLLAQNTSIIIVSHDLTTIERYSTKVMVLDSGKCHFIGQPDEGTQRYLYLLDSVAKANYGIPLSPEPSPRSDSKSTPLPDWPDESAFLNLDDMTMIGEIEMARCTRVALCDAQGQRSAVFPSGATVTFYCEFELLQDIEVPIAGITLIDANNVRVFVKNTLHSLVDVPTFVRCGDMVRLRQEVTLSIAPGEYTFSVGLATISEQDYTRLKRSAVSEYPADQVLTLIRARDIGRLLVTPRSQGIATPFAGYADLPGTLALSVVRQPANQAEVSP